MATFVHSPRTADAAICADADYADELVLTNFQIVSQSSIGGGLDELHVSADIANLNTADFTSATAIPDFSATGLGVEPGATALGFPAVGPSASVASTSDMILQVPSADVGALLTALGNGDVPFEVQASEKEVLAPGVTVNTWLPGYDSNGGGFGYQIGSGLRYIFAGASCGSPPSIVAGYNNGDPSFYILEDPSIYVPENVPPHFRNARITNVTCSTQPGAAIWDIALADTAGDILTDLVDSGTYCTTATHFIDWPVHATRLYELDGIAQDTDIADGYGQGIRFNDLPFAGGDVTVSGQVQGHVMRPRFELRIRNGTLIARTDIESDLTLTAEARVHDDVNVAPEELSLWDLCFPLPSIPLGPLSLQLSLFLGHDVGIEAELDAGAVVGFQKQFSGGVFVAYNGFAAPGQRWTSDSYNTTRPIEFTPPQLTDETGAHATVWTDIKTALRLGASYPACGPSIAADAEGYLEATVYGSLDIDPGQNPWWSLGHGADLKGGLGISVFGLPIATYDAPPVPFIGAETLDGIRPPAPPLPVGVELAAGAAPAPSLTSGEDHRWAVSVDDIGLASSLDHTSVAVAPDESIFVVSRGLVTDRNRLMKLDEFGAFQWAVQYRNGRQPDTVEALSDGSVAVAGSNLWLAKHDANGNLLWNMEYDISDPSGGNFEECKLRGMTSLEVAPGVYDYVLVGQFTRSLVTQHDACALRVDDAGAVLWAKIYGDTGIQRFNDVTPTSDGHFAMGGFNTYGPGILSESNAWVVKVDGATGNLIWSKSMPMGGIGRNRSGEWNAIEEAPDGTLYLAGRGAPVITQSGGLMVGRMDTNGGGVMHALLYEDVIWETILDFEGPVDTPAGETPFDEAFGIAVAPGGFMVVGKTGIQSGLTLDEDAQAAWALKINASLGIEWLNTVDSNPSDGVGDPLTTEVWQDVWPTPGGFVVSGMSNGFDPLGTGGGENTVVVLKYPYEGRIEFLPEANTTSRYTEPGVRFSSADARVLPDTGEIVIDAPLTVTGAQIDLSMPIVDLMVTPDDLCVTQLTESGHPSLLDQCAPDTDMDGTPDELDGCPLDPNKIEPLICGCDVLETDTDSDGTPDCDDLCPMDPNKTAPGICGCGIDDALAPSCMPPPVLVELEAIADTYVRGGAPRTNEGGSDVLRVFSARNRALVRFDQSALENLGATPISATLEIDILEEAPASWTPSGEALDVHRMLMGWEEGNGFVRGNRPAVRGTGEGATWQCGVDSEIGNRAKDCDGTDWHFGRPKPGKVNPWAAPTASAIVMAGQIGTVSFDVTADVEAFLSGTPNHGWVIKLTDTERTGRLVLGSREGGSAARLILEFPSVVP